MTIAHKWIDVVTQKRLCPYLWCLKTSLFWTRCCEPNMKLKFENIFLYFWLLLKQQNRNLENFMSYFSNYSNWKLQKHIPFSFFCFQIFFLMKLCQRKKRKWTFFSFFFTLMSSFWMTGQFCGSPTQVKKILFPSNHILLWNGPMIFFLFLQPLFLFEKVNYFILFFQHPFLWGWVDISFCPLQQSSYR